MKVHKKSLILHGPLYSLQDPLSYMGRFGSRLGFLGQRGGIRVRILELSPMISQFSGSTTGSHNKSTIFVTGIAVLDNAEGYVKNSGSRKLSDDEILNYIISREEKKDKLLMVFELTRDDREE